MFRTAVPETAVYEYRHLCSRENNVGFAPEGRQRPPMDEISKTLPMKLTAKGHLRARISTGQAAHLASNRF
jgi:hypothetical protein